MVLKKFAVQRSGIGLAWLGGALLAIAAYAIGPDRFLHACLGALGDLRAAFQGLMDALTLNAFELVRALAIGLFAVFAALGLLAVRRGLRARAALVVVGGLYLALLYPAIDGGYVASSRWFGAFLLAAVGALVMTRRLSARLPKLAAPPSAPWAGRSP